MRGCVVLVRASASSRLTTRGVSDLVTGANVATQFRRIWEAPTQHPGDVLISLRALRAERGCDLALLRSLARRFLQNAEEFFPPQIDELLAVFADLGFHDDALLRGFVGRMGDVIDTASPKRVVWIMRSGAALRLRPDAWFPHLLPQLKFHIPNMREGIPSVLSSLSELRVRDPVLAEVLLTQGLLAELDDGYFSRVFDRWSRHGLPHEEAEMRAKKLAIGASGMDVRDRLNLLSGLLRCGLVLEAEKLEAVLEDHLRRASAKEVVRAIGWMRRLCLRGVLWQSSAEGVELSLKTKNFARDHLIDAVHGLACCFGESPNDSLDSEASLLLTLITSATQELLLRSEGSQALKLLHSSCLLLVSCRPGSTAETEVVRGLPLVAQSSAVSRLCRQLSLRERRTCHLVADVLDDVGGRHALPIEDHVSRLRKLQVTSLPQIVDETTDSMQEVEVGPERYFQVDEKRCVRLLVASDLFAGSSDLTSRHTPTCKLSVRAAELRGWSVELRA